MHGTKTHHTGKTVRYRGGERHKEAVPYKRERNFRYTEIENYKLNN
jgi:hypothetical protein